MIRNRLTNEFVKKVADVYAKKMCNTSSTALAFNVNRNTIYNWRNSSKKLDELMSDAEEALLDFAESKLLEFINDGDVASLIFLLKTKGKKRGYSEKMEVEAKVDAKVTISEDEMKAELRRLGYVNE